MEKKVILVTGGSGLVGKGIILRIDIFIMLSGSGSDFSAGADPYHAHDGLNPTLLHKSLLLAVP
jgi:hypothetical protein